MIFDAIISNDDVFETLESQYLSPTYFYGITKEESELLVKICEKCNVHILLHPYTTSERID